MKKGTIILSIMLCIVMCCAMGFTALAEGDTGIETSARAGFSISGRVEAGESVSLISPYGGILLDYTVRTGDTINPGETPFQIDTTKVYAPCDGTIGGVRAQAGDDTAYIQEQYGALMYLEPTIYMRIDTTTSDAYDQNENRLVHIGETVYLKSSNNPDRTGTGYVTRVDGTSFSVEITESNLHLNERAGIYRLESYEKKSRIGIGKTFRVNPVAITGNGSVLRVLVSEGQEVKRGDMLAETVDGVFDGLTVPPDEANVSSASIVSSISVQPGGQVSGKQVIAILYPIEKLQIAADLNELDLGRVKVGDFVLVELPGLKEGNLFDGTVTTISALSHTDSGDAEYKVYIDFIADGDMREGMSATVYLAE